MSLVVAPPRAGIAARVRPYAVYVLMVLLGAAAFLYPFWLPSTALPSQAHSGDAPLVAALVGALVIAAVMLEVRRGTMNGATVAILGMLSAVAGLLRLIDLPGGGSGIFFLVILAGAAFGPRFGLLLGLCAMAVSAIVTGGIGPWLPFQMLALSWMGAGAGFAGLATRRLDPRVEVVTLAAYAWVWGFVYGAIMNLWFWPFARGGTLDWHPGLDLAQTLDRYWQFYVATSLGWDAAAATANAILVLLTGLVLMRSLRRFAHRLDPAVEFTAMEGEVASFVRE
ncbi:MAG TPA: ECF transporter S component [Acidimicrobiia bacterium]|nr:ECF transporter S component [Acidimicrobiia bacterium]